MFVLIMIMEALGCLALLHDNPELVPHGPGPWPYPFATRVLLVLFMVGWPIWRHLAPRPFHGLHFLAFISGYCGLLCILACGTRPDVTLACYRLALEAFGVTAGVLYLEIGRAVSDRRCGALARARLVQPRPEVCAEPRRGSKVGPARAETG